MAEFEYTNQNVCEFITRYHRLQKALDELRSTWGSQEGVVLGFVFSWCSTASCEIVYLEANCPKGLQERLELGKLEQEIGQIKNLHIHLPE